MKVVRIEEENARVWVSCNAARLDVRSGIEKETNNRLQQAGAGDPIRVKGKVLRVQTRTVNGENMDTGVWMDLCGVGILGYVYIGDWAQTYTPSLKGLVSYGT